ncbi:MAG: hypothetical protein ACYDEE_12945 [Ignavibacteriaceae bacterium]
MQTIKQQYNDNFITREYNLKFIKGLQGDPNFFYFLYFYTIDPSKNDKRKNEFFESYMLWMARRNSIESSVDNERILLIFNCCKVIRDKSNNNINDEIDLFDEIVFCIKYAIEHPFFFYELGEEPEDWINNLIWKDKTNNELHSYLEKYKKPGDVGYKIIIYLIRSFFLQRFDFKSVSLLLNSLHNKKVGLVRKKIKKLPTYIKNYFNSVLRILIPIIIILYAWLWKPFNISIVNSFSPITFEGDKYIINTETSSQIVHNIQFNSILGVSEVIAILLIFICLILIMKKNELIYLFLPRLFIGIIVGYLPILSGGTFWNLAVSSSVGSSIWLIFFLALTSLSLTFLYLRFEVSKGTNSSNNSIICSRTLNIFSQGIFYSFIIGLIIIDLFTSVFLRSAFALGVGELTKIEKSGNIHAALFGVIDPLIILFYFPLALFIGVVIQFIWEEKPITHPIK